MSKMGCGFIVFVKNTKYIGRRLLGCNMGGDENPMPQGGYLVISIAQLESIVKKIKEERKRSGALCGQEVKRVKKSATAVLALDVVTGHTSLHSGREQLSLYHSEQRYL